MRRALLAARRGATGQNVDSLLDTMANVVGILIVLMAVTQLSVNDAMKRIQVWESAEAVSLREARAAAEAELARRADADLADTLELSRLRDQIRRLRAAPVASDTATLAATVARQRLEARRLEARIAEEEERLANLQILLAESQARAEQPGIALRLPDPRPAPLSADRLVLFGRYGRVVDPRFDQLTRELGDVVETAPRPLDRYFEAYDVGNEMLRWRAVEKPVQAGRGWFYRLEWRRPTLGETPEQLRSPNSNLRQRLAETDPRSRYLQFYVWGDSFEAYLEARRIAEEAGFSVGWVAIPTDTPLDLERGPTPPTPVD